MQIIFAGKAHPADRPGQGVIQDIFGRSRSPKLRGRVFILEDYDIRIARFLVQGVDVWLNNPRRPLEASGTSGMKAAANGVLNVSVLDGWWDEGWTGDNGWAIGGRETNPDEGAQDWADSQDLYRILETGADPRLLRARRGRRPAALDAADAQLDRQHDLALLHDPHAPRVRGAPVPAGGRPRDAPEVPAHGRSRGPVAALTRIAKGGTPWHPASRWPSPSTTTSRSATSAGCSPRCTSRPTCRWSRPSSATRASASRCTTRARCSSGWRPSDPPSSSGCARSSTAARSRSSAAACTSRSSPRCPSSDRVDQLTRMAEVVEGIAGRRPLGAWLAERVWEPDLPTALVGAGYRWTILDDQHFRAAVDPRGEPVGRLHDRGPGPAADGLRDRAGPALPDPVRGRRGRHRLPPRPRDRGRRPGRDDGRRRREVRRVADDLRALLGRAAAGSSGSSRRSRRTATG